MENNEKQEDRIEIHQESGLSYYKIKLLGDGENTIYLRLFESTSPGRLKFKEDEETRDEYLVRRAYMKKLDKQRKAGQLVWNSAQWGSLTQANAIRLQAALNEGKDINEIIKM